MITVQLMGGLGNQMFQYAHAKAMGLRYNDSYFLDAQALFHDIREYELGIFSIDEHLATAKERPRYLILFKNKLLHKIWYIFMWVCKKLDRHYFIENPHHPKVHINMYDYQPRVRELADTHNHTWYFEGFWQSEKYFHEISDQLRKDFMLKEPLQDDANVRILEGVKHTNSISIHVRRSDYIGSHFAGICTPEYYEKAITHIKQLVSSPQFFVFSDDIARCKENLSLGKDASFIDWNKGKDSYKDLILMSNCKHNIIANSSFSWRGAWLNTNPEKIVIAPPKWHQHLDYKDIVPAQWIRM